MGPLPSQKEVGNRYILVVTDLFSKWVEAFPLQVTDGLTLTSILMDEMICRFGVPQQLHSDQGSNLNAEVNQKLCQLLGIEHTRTTAYHPQGNGQVERFNHTVEAMLAKMVGDHHSDWDKHFYKKSFFAYRTSLHDSKGTHHILSTLNVHRSCLLMSCWVVLIEKGMMQYSSDIKEVRKTLKNAYDVIHVNLDATQKKGKM